MGKLLLLEDDPVLSKTLIRYLSSHGYTVDWAKDGDEAADMSYDSSYDLYLFDINVPLMNGVDLLASLRDAGDMTPTIIVSALVDVESVTNGFIAGADDYIKKPFDPDELLVRIKAKTKALKEVIRFKNFEIDIKNDNVTADGKDVYLGDVQKKLFVSLVQNYPNPVTKDELMLLLEKPTDLALRVNIAKLKKNLSVDIRSVRGVGYQII